MRRQFDAQGFVKLRKDLELSQNAMARDLGITPESIANYEHGRSQPAGWIVDRIWRDYIIPKGHNIELYKEAVE